MLHRRFIIKELSVEIPGVPVDEDASQVKDHLLEHSVEGNGRVCNGRNRTVLGKEGTGFLTMLTPLDLPEGLHIELVLRAQRTGLEFDQPFGV